MKNSYKEQVVRLAITIFVQLGKIYPAGSKYSVHQDKSSPNSLPELVEKEMAI